MVFVFGISINFIKMYILMFMHIKILICILFDIILRNFLILNYITFLYSKTMCLVLAL